MLALVLGVLALAPGTPARDDDAYAEVQALLGERRLSDAWDLVPEIGDPLLAARAVAELFYLARDFPRCIEAADAGLALQPNDLLLLYRALGATLWMRDGKRGVAWSSRLAEAVKTADLGPEERVWWDDNISAMRTDAEGFIASARARDRRVERARVVSLLGIAAVLGGLALLTREPKPGYG